MIRHGRDFIKVLKPNPEGLEFILSQLGVSTNEEDGIRADAIRTDGVRNDGIRKSDILYIGDRTEKDGLCAQKVGVDFFLWTTGRFTIFRCCLL